MRFLTKYLPTVPTKVRFGIAYASLGFCVVAFTFAFAIQLGASGPKSVVAKAAVKVQVAKPQGPEGSTAALQFAREAQGTANAYAIQAGAPERVNNMICVMGDPNDFFCAYWLTGHGTPRCMGLMLSKGPEGITVTNKKSGGVKLPREQCSAINALHWIGSQPG